MSADPKHLVGFSDFVNGASVVFEDVVFWSSPWRHPDSLFEGDLAAAGGLL
jgi:hypothetical protein